jgi:RecG wedge domain
VPEPAGAPPAPDPLAQFLDAVRRPLEFLAAAPPAAAARTRLPGRALAARGRALRSRLADEPRRIQLDALCANLERLEDAGPAERVPLGSECRRLLAQIDAPGAPGADLASAYRPSTGDLAGALTRLSAPVQFAKEVGPRRAALLRKFGIETVEDLLYHLPFRYEDRRRVREIGSTEIGEEASIIGELAQLQERTVGRGRRRLLEGVLRDATGLLGLTWYNQVTYFRSRFRVGQRLLVYGKVDRSPGGGKRIVHPEVDGAPDEAGGMGVLPVYEKPTSMTVGTMRKIVQHAVRDYADLIPGTCRHA